MKNTKKLAFFLSLFIVFTLIFGQVAYAAYQRTYDIRYDGEDSGRYRMNSELRNKINELGEDPVKDLRIPILFRVKVINLEDTWGDARSNGRTHEGIDILVPRGSFVVSPTDAVVSTIEDSGNGGKHVFTINPGGERFYYAHLDAFGEGLNEGDVLKPGDLIGYVGNTGNASAGPTHLHFGIYDDNHDTTNPFPRLTKEFSLEDSIDALEKILDNSNNKSELTQKVVQDYRAILSEAQAKNITLPTSIRDALILQKTIILKSVVRDLTVGSRGPDVVWLQEFLIRLNLGPASLALANDGVDGIFGSFTRNAVSEYQTKLGLKPAKGKGYFDATTRDQMKLIAAVLNY